MNTYEPAPPSNCPPSAAYNLYKSPSNEEKKAILQDVLDPRKVVVHCGKHQYMPASLFTPPPVSGCKECWQAFYVTLFGKIPPHKRQEEMERFEEVVRKVVESVEKGEWDFAPFKHPEVKIHKGVS